METWFGCGAPANLSSMNSRSGPGQTHNEQVSVLTIDTARAQGGTEALGLAGDDLHTRRKGNQRKVTIARRLRQETRMSLKRIAQRLDGYGQLDLRLQPATGCATGRTANPATTTIVCQ